MLDRGHQQDALFQVPNFVQEGDVLFHARLHGERGLGCYLNLAVNCSGLPRVNQAVGFSVSSQPVIGDLFFLVVVLGLNLLLLLGGGLRLRTRGRWN